MLQLCEFFPSVVWHFLICCHKVHHCLSHFIFLRKNPHTGFTSLCFMQNWGVFFLILGEEKSTLMKRFPPGSCYCWSRPEQSSELSLRYGHTDPAGWQRGCQLADHTYRLDILAQPYISLSHVGVLGTSHVTSEWRSADMWWWVTQIRSAWGLPPATSLLSLPRLCCLPQASSGAILFHRFFSMIESRGKSYVLKTYKHSPWDSSGNRIFRCSLGTRSAWLLLLVVKLWGLVRLLFWRGLQGFVCLFVCLITY